MGCVVVKRVSIVCLISEGVFSPLALVGSEKSGLIGQAQLDMLVLPQV